MEIPEWFKKGLIDLGGRNFFGEPNLRVVWSPYERHTQGLAKGTWKYPDIDNPGKPMECWVLESYAPPQFFEGQWNSELLGEFPSRGKYVMRTPLKIGDEVLKLDEACLEAIRGQRKADIEWGKKSFADRQMDIDKSYAHNQRLREERSRKESEDAFDYMVGHEGELNASVTRVFSMPKHLETTRAGSKMPVER